MSLVEEKDDGGSAFPMAGNESYHPDYGMSLRDYFAGQALAGLLSVPNIAHLTESKVARMAYDQADAMLEVRKNG